MAATMLRRVETNLLPAAERAAEIPKNAALAQRRTTAMRELPDLERSALAIGNPKPLEVENLPPLEPTDPHPAVLAALRNQRGFRVRAQGERVIAVGGEPAQRARGRRGVEAGGEFAPRKRRTAQTRSRRRPAPPSDAGARPTRRSRIRQDLAAQPAQPAPANLPEPANPASPPATRPAAPSRSLRPRRRTSTSVQPDLSGGQFGLGTLLQRMHDQAGPADKGMRPDLVVAAGVVAIGARARHRKFERLPQTMRDRTERVARLQKRTGESRIAGRDQGSIARS